MRIGIDARKIADYGIGTYVRGLLGGLASMETSEEFVVFAPPGTPIPARFEHVSLDAPHYSARELIVLGRAIDAARIDVFHAPHYVLPLTRRPTVVTIHDLIHLHVRHRNPLKPLYARAMLGRAVRKARRLLTVSEAVRRDIIATFGCDEGKLLVTPNGIDARFTPGDAERGTFFLYVGNDKPHKNVERLVDAFARVHAEEPSLQLVLAGALFARFQSRAGVITPGFVSDDELLTLYRTALAVVVPSEEEGFGLPAAEAMACATPVITSHAAALVEVTGEAALHVAPHELADAMLRIARDGDLRARLASRGVDRARAFTWRRCAELTMLAYKSARE